MKQIVADAIRFYYEENNDAVYLVRCKESLDVADVVATTAAEFSQEVSLPDSYWSFWPAYKVRVGFPTCSRGLFEAEFATEIFVSKLVRVFHVRHLFSVENQHERRIAPALDGYGNTGYIMSQFDMHEVVRERLAAHHYTELDLADMDEVIPSLSFPPDVTIFGRQVRVEFALFHDLLGLCPDE